MNARILLTATGSGCGKTTITIALLKALTKRGLKVASFKCGPDYIDPMYHRKTLGIPAYNLDPFFCDNENLRQVLANGLAKNDIGVIEGVMGYYDGYGIEGKASTWEVADITDTPSILIVNAKGMSNSVGAILRGFTGYKEEHHIKGVIFNNISGGMYPVLSEIAKNEGLIPLGFMPYNPEIALESRHLGLITADELADIQNTIDALGGMALENLDIDGIIALANESSALDETADESSELDTSFDKNSESDMISDKSGIENDADFKPRLAVAKDDAFCFIYQENIDILSKLGCELVYFSPLMDAALPDNCDGLYLPGGYPEIYAERLSNNSSMLKCIKEAVNRGLPTIAECGGFMYLHEMLEGKPMAGVVKGSAIKQKRLVRFGYGTMKAKVDGLLLKAGDSVRIHEFHYYDSDNNGDAFEVTKASNGMKYECAYSADTLYAGYPHLYFRANINVVKNFMAAMKKYRD